MPVYDVTVVRTGIGFKTIRISDCPDQATAIRRAEEKAPNLEFTEKDADYQAEDCTEVTHTDDEPEQFKFAFA